MRLNQKNLRSVLAAIFDVDEKFVVPRQGTFWNPTVDPKTGHPMLWVGYRLEEHRPITLSHYLAEMDSEPTNWDCREKISRLSLQLVGEDSEDVANSVAFWPDNAKVQEAFADFEGRVMADVGNVIATPFAQDGANEVIAHNVTVRIAWTDMIDSGQGLMPDLVFEGEVIING